MNPLGMSTRLAAAADIYQLYRLNKFRFRFVPGTLASETIVGAYYSNVIDATATFATAAESDFAVPFGLQMTNYSDWCVVPQHVLRGALPWYKSIQGAQTDWEELAGTIQILSNNAGSTAVITIEIEGIMEFQSPIDPSLTPEVRKTRELARRKAELLRILSYDDSGVRIPGTGTLGQLSLPAQTAGKSGKTL